MTLGPAGRLLLSSITLLTGYQFPRSGFCLNCTFLSDLIVDFSRFRGIVNKNAIHEVQNWFAPKFTYIQVQFFYLQQFLKLCRKDKGLSLPVNSLSRFIIILQSVSELKL